MKKRQASKQAINAAYYEDNCLVDEFAEAERNGELLRPHGGKNAIQVMRDYMQAKKKTTVSMRLPTGIVNEVKAQAKAAGVPWTSYICAVLERYLAKPQIRF